MKTPKETKEERIARWALAPITFYIVTSAHNWGKGSTLPEAIKNAQWKRGQEIAGEIYVCSPNDVQVGDHTLSRPEGTLVYSLNDWKAFKI